jgi:hypothetical protein
LPSAQPRATPSKDNYRHPESRPQFAAVAQNRAARAKFLTNTSNIPHESIKVEFIPPSI